MAIPKPIKPFISIKEDAESQDEEVYCTAWCYSRISVLVVTAFIYLCYREGRYMPCQEKIMGLLIFQNGCTLFAKLAMT